MEFRNSFTLSGKICFVNFAVYSPQFADVVSAHNIKFLFNIQVKDQNGQEPETVLKVLRDLVPCITPIRQIILILSQKQKNVNRYYTLFDILKPLCLNVTVASGYCISPAVTSKLIGDNDIGNQSLKSKRMFGFFELLLIIKEISDLVPSFEFCKLAN